MSSKKWKVLNSTQVFSGHFFKLNVEKCELPDGRIMPEYYILNFADWVNVIPITSDNEVVLIRQYRHGANEIFWEVPGGAMHLNSLEEGVLESPQIAAQRELLEETGYVSESWLSIGEHYPNPALQNNRMHTFWATDCRKVSEPNLDEFEDIEVVLMPVAQVIRMIRNGDFKHSIILASMILALKHLEDLLKL